MKAYVGIAVVIIGGVAAATYLTETPEQKFVRACEEAIVDRLKAPDSYKRIEVWFTRGPYEYWKESSFSFPSQATFDGALAALEAAGNKGEQWSHMKMHQRKADYSHRVTGHFEFTAANSYNAQTRGYVTCTEDTDKDNRFPDPDHLPYLNWRPEILFQE